MKQNQSSQSALGVALFRAIESQKPEATRICYDPYARAFIPTVSYILVKLMVDSGLYERIGPGAVGFITVRERYIDDYLKTGLAQGLEQVVILGAGFDTRAYRIPGIEKTRVFEIDYPATQEIKRKELKKVIDPLPEYVTFLPVDFNTQALTERLQSCGYNEQAKTLFIWQGVTYFLAAQSVDSTLDFIANHSGKGSSVIFDYMYNEIFQDPNNSYGKTLKRVARMSGEQYMFGVDRGQVEPFLTRRGFRNVHNLTLEELKQRYFTGPNAGRVVPADIAIVSAEVNKGETQRP
jgi:methyltransferase (TIGR00027 family)